MEYTITAFQAGTIEVECQGHRFGVTLPLIDGEYPTGADLRSLILSFVPLGEIDRLTQEPTNTTAIESLIGQPVSFDRSEAEAAQVPDQPEPEVLV